MFCIFIFVLSQINAKRLSSNAAFSPQSLFQQAAEKALKAAQYNADANKMNVHNLVENSLFLGDPELAELARQLEILLGESTRMRYPDRVCYPQIPNDAYSAEMAEEALEITTKVVERVRGRLA